MERPPSISARIAAGLAAPVAGSFVWSLFSNLAMGMPIIDAGGIGFALICGAPLSVPVSLALAPQRLWLALPAISLAAAVGIALQMPLLFSEQSLSNVLMFVWIIPAMLGAGTALLLRYYDRPSFHIAIGIPAVLALTALNQPMHGTQLGH